MKDNTVISTPISFFYMNATGNVSFKLFAVVQFFEKDSNSSVQQN